MKRIPSKGIESEEYKQFHTQISDFKKDLKSAVKTGINMLLEDFLSGAEISPAQWKARYHCFISHTLAKSLVWAQGENTFLITESGLINEDEDQYLLADDQPVRLAHPMEMKMSIVNTWQKYFTAHKIKQPFLQIWEPITDFSSIQQDRYKGVSIDRIYIQNQQKRGIDLDIMPWEIKSSTVYFKDCSSEVQLNWDMDTFDTIEIISFMPKKRTRGTNHIITYLDRLTAKNRILKDDISVSTFLPSLTLAQITYFLNLAMENNCPNVTALLLNYKNEHFSDFDPMEEFTLGEL